MPTEPGHERPSLKSIMPPERFRQIALRTDRTVALPSISLRKEFPDPNQWYGVILNVFAQRDFYFTQQLFENVSGRLPHELREPVTELFSQRHPDRAGEFAAIAREIPDPQPVDPQQATRNIVTTVLERYPTDQRPDKSYPITDLPLASITEARRLLRKEQGFESTVKEVEDSRSGLVETMLTVKPIGHRAEEEREQRVAHHVSEILEAAKEGRFYDLPTTTDRSLIVEVVSRLKSEHGLDTTVDTAKGMQYEAFRLTSVNTQQKNERTISGWVSEALANAQKGVAYAIMGTPDAALLRQAITKLEEQGYKVKVEDVRERAHYTRLTLTQPTPPSTPLPLTKYRSGTQQKRQLEPEQAIPKIELLSKDISANYREIQRLMDDWDLLNYAIAHYQEGNRVIGVLQQIVQNASLFPSPDYGKYAQQLSDNIENIGMGKIREQLGKNLPELGKPQY